MPVVRISDELFKEIQKYAEPLVDTFEDALWKALQINRQVTSPPKAGKRPKETGDVTHYLEYTQPILQCLVGHGGEAAVPIMEQCVLSLMQNMLKPGDYESNTDGTVKWKKAMHFRRLGMVQEGLIDKHSPRGIWKITDEGRQILNTYITEPRDG